ncbi:unnamed protein product [Symbiodinium natans]|uniref:Uncharacterized protein n=1 Tax=Symbiodinium natans TaxID=878477 RepID=A0A812PAL4_9DINO|nr:unnamed protein product [Symbiodinium natans]
MGKGYKGKGGGARRRSQGSEDEQPKKWERKYLQAVDSKWHFGKANLRAYASDTGSPFYTKGKSDAEHLALRSLSERLTPATSEACNRMGIALSEGGGTVNMMAAFVDKYLENMEDASEKLGLKALAEGLGKSKGEQLRQVAAFFDKNFEGDKPTLSVEEAAAAWVTYFSTDSKEGAKPWQRLARSAATQYVFAMEMLQWFALCRDPKAWVEKMKTQKDLQPEAVQKWMRGPSSKERLVEALAKSYLAQVGKKSRRTCGLSSEASDTDEGKKDKKKRKEEKKRKRSSSSKTSASSSASSATKAASSGSSKQKKKDQKGKKKDKDAADKKSKADKKEKKTKKDKKRKSASSAEQSSPVKKPKKAAVTCKLFKDVDEGMLLDVDDKTHKNCCLPLSLARATLGPTAKKEEVHTWAAEWIKKLPENKQKACRVAANEAKLGEGLYEDYVKFEVDQESARAKIVFVVDTAEAKTKVWAGEDAAMGSLNPIFVRHEGFHFTALLPQSSDISTVLPDLPPIEAFSYVGPAELLMPLLKAQKPSK